MDNWDHFYKHYRGSSVANMLYEPLVNDDRTVFCMNWNPNDYYNNELMSEDLYQYWFEREVKYLSIIKNKNYAPEVLDIDYSRRKIKFRWYDKNLNILISNNKIRHIDDWQEKIKKIKQDLEQNKIYKINMYPHTFYFDDKDQAHCMDMYGCTDNDTKYISAEYLKPLISNDRFSKFTINNTVDTHELYQETISTNYAQWPGDFLNV